MYKLFFRIHIYTSKFCQKTQRIWLKLEEKIKTAFKTVLLRLGWGSRIKIKEKYITLGAIFILTLFLSLILSASTELKKSSAIASADVSEISEGLISELMPPDNLACEKTVSDATLTCQDYYNNIVDAQKPEDFLNVYLVEDSEFVFGSQNRSEQTIVGTTDKNQLMTYTIVAGDTLGKIAEKFGVSIDTIKVANRLTKNVLTPGKELVILPVSGVYYVVKKGDTLGRIASQYKISVSSILEYNGVDEKHIKIGDKIILPGAKAVAEISKTSSATQVSNIGSSVSGYFIYPTTGWNWGQLHNNNAVDIASSCGTPVYAAADGIVISAVSGSWNGGYGTSIKIQHPNGTTTLYAHLSTINIGNGASVKQGDFIGKMGTTGKSTGCHLHFEVSGAKNPFVK